jgi:hypothetical protein
LATKLDLHRQRRALDERIEIVEAVLDAQNESLNHLQALAFQVVFEMAIVLLLLLDCSLVLWDFLGR